MRTRALGSTDLEVSELSLGTWGLSGDAYGPVASEEADRVLDRAVALGITLFETSDAYGRGAMERRLRARLAGNRAVVATKIGTRYEQSRPRKRFDAASIRDSFQSSEERLGGAAALVVLLHNPSEAALRTDEPLGVLRELAAQGRVRAYGVSAGNSAVARAALLRGAQVVELAYNALFPTDVADLELELVTRRAGLLARSVLAHGLLAGQWSSEREFPEGDHRADRWTREELRTRLDQLDLIRPAVGGAVLTLRAAALRFVLSSELVSSAVLGTRSVHQLDQLVREAGSGPPYLREEVLNALWERIEEHGLV